MQNSKEKLILSISILVALVALGVLVFFFKTIENKNKHTSVLLTTLAEKMKQKDNMKDLVDKVNKVKDLSNQIDSYFVNSKEIDSFVSYLEGLGESAGVTLEVKNFDISSVSSNMLNVVVSTKGSFANTMRVLMLIETSPYKVTLVGTKMGQTSEFTGNDPKKQVQTSFWRSEISFSVLISS